MMRESIFSSCQRKGAFVMDGLKKCREIDNIVLQQDFPSDEVIMIARYLAMGKEDIWHILKIFQFGRIYGIRQERKRRQQREG